MEIWKDIQGFEGFYQVSNLGRVKRSDTGRLLKPGISNGYFKVRLSKDGKSYSKRINRLVAQAFIPNPQNLPEVNHKDECKTNNFVYVNQDGSIDESKSNLEWCTRKYNTNYGRGIERSKASRCTPIVQCLKNGKPFIFWMGIRQIKRSKFLVDSSGIYACLNGKQKTAKGFKWRRPTTVELKYIKRHMEKLAEFYKAR